MEPCNTLRKNETENPQLTRGVKDMKSEIELRKKLDAVTCAAFGIDRE